ncbi:MAG: hypothetical protein P4L51_14215 [Puia sp.]|nr:hypothetical protein [Puia sp.]
MRKLAVLAVLGISFSIATGADRVDAPSITIMIECRGAVRQISVRTAPFKYNKDFAWSFTLDDGVASGALVAFPYFNGGRVAPSLKGEWGIDQGGDGQDYPGLFFTDGCGNKVPFRAAVAINGKSIGRSGFLSWGQVGTLYKAGWDVFNHGYAHATGNGVDVDFECRENNRIVREKGGITMRQFVVPGGAGETISEGPYTKAAFDQGMEAVHDGHVPGHVLLMDTALSLREMRAGRQFLFAGNIPDSAETYFREIRELLQAGKKPWFNAFTHGTGNDNLWRISLPFPDLKIFFGRLEKEYGQNGKDNVWFASFQEVQEYSLIRQSLVYSVRKKGNRIYIRIDTGKLPPGLRHRCQTFILDGGQAIERVSCTGGSVESFSKNAAGSKLVNWCF